MTQIFDIKKYGTILQSKCFSCVNLRDEWIMLQLYNEKQWIILYCQLYNVCTQFSSPELLVMEFIYIYVICSDHH
jgi:hypothetical protein